MNGNHTSTRSAAAALLRGDAIAGPHLVVAEGPEKGRRIPLAGDQTLGRGRAADVRLADPSASRLHVRLSSDGRRWLVLDLGSKNGLCVNGRRCRRPRPIRAGDELTVGATRLVLAPGLLDEPVAAPAVPEPPKESPATDGSPRRTIPGAALLAFAGALAATAALLLAVP